MGQRHHDWREHVQVNECFKQNEPPMVPDMLVGIEILGDSIQQQEVGAHNCTGFQSQPIYLEPLEVHSAQNIHSLIHALSNHGVSVCHDPQHVPEVARLTSHGLGPDA